MNNSITQDMRYKQSVIEYSFKYGVTKAAIKYRQSRQNIYRWREKYDGTTKSLALKSRKPYSHPNQHTEKELTLIKNMKRNNKDTGLVVLWVKLKQRGYSRSITSLYRVMVRVGVYNRVTHKRKYVSKPYEQMEYTGQRVQVDVKYVPMECLTKELRERKERYFQYTAIDEYSRQRYIWFSKEKTTYASKQFVERLVNHFKYNIECIQTDNGFEFTNRLGQDKNKETIFEKTLREQGIRYKQIRPYTPRHNGKVERSHRKDQENFYNKRTFYSFEDLINQSKYYIKSYNNFPMKPLKWKTPNEMVEMSIVMG